MISREFWTRWLLVVLSALLGYSLVLAGWTSMMISVVRGPLRDESAISPGGWLSASARTTALGLSATAAVTSVAEVETERRSVVTL